MSELINGVPCDKYGLWCRHGHHLYVVDSDDASDYPGTVAAEPWPCAEGCTPESVAEAMDKEAARWEADRWDEYWSMQ